MCLKCYTPIASKRKFELKDGGNIIEAEKSARDSLIRRERIHGETSENCAFSIDALIQILELKGGGCDDELKELYKRSLDIYITNEGNTTVNVATANSNLGAFHMKVSKSSPPGDGKKEHLYLAQPYIEEAARITNELYGPLHHTTMKYASNLSKMIRLQKLIR